MYLRVKNGVHGNTDRDVYILTYECVHKIFLPIGFTFRRRTVFEIDLSAFTFYRLPDSLHPSIENKIFMNTCIQI